MLKMFREFNHWGISEPWTRSMNVLGSGLRLKGRQYGIDGVVGCLRNFRPSTGLGRIRRRTGAMVLCPQLASQVR
jgi:hypothetical protein